MEHDRASIFLIVAILAVLLMPFRAAFGGSAWTPSEYQFLGQNDPQNKTEGRKTGGIVGDPSRQRGFELGYDAGPKAGREDRAANKPPDPSIRSEYKKPDQFYRYEYGSRAAFVSGFRNGFLRGYKSYSGRVEFKRAETTQETATAAFRRPRKVPSETGKAREPFPKSISLAKDAL